MKEFFSKTWVKISAIALAVFLFLFSILLLLNSFAPYNPKCYHVFGLSGVSGSFDKNGNPKTYYQVEQTTSVIELVHLNALNSNVYYVWINVSDMVEDSTIYLYNGGDSSAGLVCLSEYFLSGKELSKDNDGWICIYDRTKTSAGLSKHFYLGTKSKIRIREVVFLNNVKTDPSISFTVDDLVRRSTPEVSGDSLYQAFNYEELINSNKYTATFTKELQERMRTFTNLNDEQSTFDKSKIK